MNPNEAADSGLLLAGVPRRATGSGLPGDTGALLLDVEEALVDEFVDAEGA